MDYVVNTKETDKTMSRLIDRIKYKSVEILKWMVSFWANQLAIQNIVVYVFVVFASLAG